MQIDGGRCDNGRRFYAQAAVAQRHRLPALLQREGHLSPGEVAFGADHYRNLRLCAGLVERQVLQTRASEGLKGSDALRRDR